MTVMMGWHLFSQCPYLVYESMWVTVTQSVSVLCEWECMDLHVYLYAREPVFANPACSSLVCTIWTSSFSHTNPAFCLFAAFQIVTSPTGLLQQQVDLFPLISSHTVSKLKSSQHNISDGWGGGGGSKLEPFVRSKYWWTRVSLSNSLALLLFKNAVTAVPSC